MILQVGENAGILATEATIDVVASKLRCLSQGVIEIIDHQGELGPGAADSYIAGIGRQGDTDILNLFDHGSSNRILLEERKAGWITIGS